MENDILEPLYASAELESAYRQGIREGRARMEHIIKKEVVRVRKGKWGVVNNGQLLNPSFKSEAEAAVFITGLVPSNPKMREQVKINAIAVRL